METVNKAKADKQLMYGLSDQINTHQMNVMTDHIGGKNYNEEPVAKRPNVQIQCKFITLKLD